MKNIIYEDLIYDKVYLKNNNATPKRVKSIFKYILYLLIVSFIIYCFSSLSWNHTQNWNKWVNQALKLLFVFDPSDKANYPSYSLWYISFRKMAETFEYTALGSLVGFVIAYFTAYGASYNLHKKKYFVYFSKITIFALRCLPVLFWMFIFKEAFDKLLCASLLLTWFTWLWLHKYLMDVFEASDTQNYQNDLLLGRNKFKAFYKNISNKNKNKIVMLFLYSFESNLRWTTLLSGVGLTGIGELIDRYSKDPDSFKYLGIPLFVLLINIIIIELFNILINYLMFKTPSIKANDKHKKIKLIFYRPNFWIWLMLAFIIVLSIIALVQIDWSVYHKEAVKSLWLDFTNPDYSKAFSSSYDLFSLFWVLIKITTCVLFLSFLAAILIAFLANERLNKKYQVYFLKILLVFFRTFPVLVIFRLYAIVYDTNSNAAIMVLSLFYPTMASLSKFFIESINAIDDKDINNLRLKNWPNFKIFWNFILPKIKKDLFSYSTFRFELIFRNTITYGSFCAIGVGTSLYVYLYDTLRLDYRVAAGYMLPIIIVILIIQLLVWIIKFLSNRKSQTRQYS